MVDWLLYLNNKLNKATKRLTGGFQVLEFHPSNAFLEIQNVVLSIYTLFLHSLHTMVTLRQTVPFQSYCLHTSILSRIIIAISLVKHFCVLKEYFAKVGMFFSGLVYENVFFSLVYTLQISENHTVSRPQINLIHQKRLGSNPTSLEGTQNFGDFFTLHFFQYFRYILQDNFFLWNCLTSSNVLAQWSTTNKVSFLI